MLNVDLILQKSDNDRVVKLPPGTHVVTIVTDDRGLIIDSDHDIMVRMNLVTKYEKCGV